MADNVVVTAGTGTTVAADEVVDGTLGTVKVQYVKIMDATLDGTTKAAVGAAGLKVDGSGATQPVSGTVTANIGTGITKAAGAADATTTRVTIDTGQLGNLGIAAKTASVPSVAATDQPTLAIAHDTTQLMKGASGVGVTPVSVAIVASASGATSIVAAQGVGNKILVIQWDVKVNAAVNFKWQSAANDLTGLYYNGAQGDGVARAFSPIGYFKTNANEALNINLSGAVALGGSLTYVVVT